MQLVPAVCPQCSSALTVPEGAVKTVCEYCKVEVFLKRDATAQDAIPDYIVLAKSALSAKNFSEAYSYYTRVLELDTRNAEAWAGKGTAAGYLSNLLGSRFEETKECYRNGLNCTENEGAKQVLAQECAVTCVLLARAYFDISLQHTLEFIAVSSASHEHIDRCVEVINFCNFAKSLDADVPGASALINDVSSRMLKYGKISADEKQFFTAEKAKNAPPASAKGPADKGEGSDSTAAVAVMLMAAAYAASYFALKQFGVQSTFWALFFSLILSIPVMLAGFVLFASVAIRFRKTTQNQ